MDKRLIDSEFLNAQFAAAVQIAQQKRAAVMENYMAKIKNDVASFLRDKTEDHAPETLPCRPNNR